MDEYEKLKKASYVSKRMFIIKKICEKNNVDIEYLFGLFNLYNQKNSGRWFWQKAQFTGALKDRYDEFNKIADRITKEIKRDTEQVTKSKIEAAKEPLNKLMQGMEMSLEVDRGIDRGYIKGFLDDNLKSLINDGLRGLV
ncbi:MAG: hypothetical protein R6U35_02010 [Candidatus Humimicrobiaceae bacterium]